MTALSLSRAAAPRRNHVATLGGRLARYGAALALGRARRVTTAELSQLDARTLRDIGLAHHDIPGTAAALVQDLALRLSLR